MPRGPDRQDDRRVRLPPRRGVAYSRTFHWGTGRCQDSLVVESQ